MSKKLKNIYYRDRGYCWICGKYVEKKDASVEHVFPKRIRSKYPNILRLAHVKCNGDKGEDDPMPYIMNEWLRWYRKGQFTTEEE